jgi:hypothetical protein
MASNVKAVYIQREEWGADKGKLNGSITFEGALGEVKVRLNNTKAQAIIALLADELVACAQDTAALMRSELLELPAPAVEV